MYTDGSIREHHSPPPPHFLGPSWSVLRPPRAPFVSLMYTECKHRRIQGLVLSSVLILYYKHGACGGLLIGLACLARTRDWPGPDQTHHFSLIRYEIKAAGIAGRMMSVLSGIFKPGPSLETAGCSGRPAGGTAGPLQNEGTSADNLTLLFKPSSCKSPPNSKMYLIYWPRVSVETSQSTGKSFILGIQVDHSGRLSL